ncbi:MAG: pyridoxal phosphate-dependent aminotransferase [Candidatus Aminicenantes bacterium]
MKHFLSQRMQGIEKTLIRQIHDRADSSCINLGLGEPAFPPPPSLMDRLKENIGHWKWGYSPNAGLEELRSLVAEKSGLPFTADQVCITVGAEEALFSILMVSLNPGDEVLIPDPGFPAYESMVKIAGGQPKHYSLHRENDFSLKSEDIQERITEKTKIIILNSPHNPTGAVYLSEELIKLAEFLKQKDILAVSDEVYKDIYFLHQPDSIARYMSRCVVINSLSKTYSMTGWRLGWCLVPSSLIKPVVAFHQISVICAPVISQQMALLALKGRAEKERLNNLKELEKRKNFAVRCVEKYTDLKHVNPLGAFYLFVDVSAKTPGYGRSLDISLSLLSKKKVVTIPGAAFGKNGEGYLRISFAPSPQKIEEGIKRIGQFFA